MNGTIIFGVALIAVGLFTGGPWLIGLLVAGVVVAAFGAFVSPDKRVNAPKRLPTEYDPFV
jgi:hypothetical protein